MRLVTSFGNFARRHRLAASLFGVVAACSVIIPACEFGRHDPDLATSLTFDATNPREVRAGQSVTVTARLLDETGAVVYDNSGNELKDAITYSIAPADQAFATIAPKTGVVTATTVMNEASHTITVNASAVVPSGFTPPPPATFQLTVLSRVTSVTLTPSAFTMRVGDPPRSLVPASSIAAGSPTTPAVTYTYTSSNPLQASVDAQGQVRAVSATATGTPVTITATAEGVTSNGVNSTLVTVLPPLNTTIVVTPKTKTVQVNETFTFSAPISNPGPGTPVPTWSSADQSRVAISPQGTITGIAPTLPNTPVRITARYNNGTTTVEDFADVTVVPIPPSVVITTKPARVMVPGETQLLAAAVSNPGPGQVTVAWASQDQSRLTVNSNGLVTAVAPTLPNTPVRVTATYTSGGTSVSDFVDITVNQAPVVRVTTKTLSVVAGQKTLVLATVDNPVTGVSLVFESADPSKATVNPSTGEVTGVAPTAPNTPVRVTAKYTVNGVLFSDFADVTVTAAANPSIGVTGFQPNSSAATTISPTVPLVLPVANGSHITVTVTNPVAGGTLAVSVRDPSLATYSPSTNNGTTATGTLQGKGTGSTFLDVSYTANGTTITQAIPITVGTAGLSRVTRVILEPQNNTVAKPVGFSYRPRFLDANLVTLTAAEVAADGGTIRFFNSDNNVGTVVQSTTAPTQAQFTPQNAGTTNVQVLYSKNGTDVATDNTNATVTNSTSNVGSLTISTAGDARNVRTGASNALLFQVIVRDQSNVIVTTGTAPTVTLTPAVTSPNQPNVIARSGDPNGFFYTIQGGTPGSYTLTATLGGVTTSIPIVITN